MFSCVLKFLSLLTEIQNAVCNLRGVGGGHRPVAATAAGPTAGVGVGQEVCSRNTYSELIRLSGSGPVLCKCCET